MKKCCVITDNRYLYTEIKRIIKKHKLAECTEFCFFRSKSGNISELEKDVDEIPKPIDLRSAPSLFHKSFDLFLSLHCRQIFPECIVRECRCINIHPGYNPYNRGWYPQVFSIINKKPIGVTIHEMDAEIDHGPVIARELVEISESDTSYDVYQKIQQKECQMLEKYLSVLIEGNYEKQFIKTEGNINYKKDFEKLRKIDMGKTATYGEVIDFLRAMTFGDYKNAYFIDSSGKKIYIKVEMEKDEIVRGGGYIIPYSYPVYVIFNLKYPMQLGEK